MIKSVQHDHDKTPAIEYPCIQISKLDGVIVLFWAPKTGIVVNAKSAEPIGSFSTFWSMSNFEPYNGTIELSNEEA